MADEKQVVTAADVGTLDEATLTAAPTPEKMPRLKALFNELRQQKAAILARVQEARTYYESHVNDAKFLEAKRVIKETNKELAPIENELAGLARALGARGIKIEAGEYKAG